VTEVAAPLASPMAGQVVPGVLGFLVVAAMGLALYFLLRSMNKQLRKVVKPPVWHGDPPDPSATSTKPSAPGSS
jgi:hypothetical protein